MTSQSLPPPDTVNDSLHLLDIGGQETAAHWDADNRLWFPLGAYSFDADLPFERPPATCSRTSGAARAASTRPPPRD